MTGHLGYIGSVLVPLLQGRGHEVTGCDIGYYEECRLDGTPFDIVFLRKDIRALTAQDLADMDAVIHLAALSNDPLGDLNPSLTEDINFKGTAHLAVCAKNAGVKRFVFSSSQSMYGISESVEELDEDKSSKHPLTAYADTKWRAEEAIRALASDDFIVTVLRPSTVFGVSPYLRSDIVLNSLTGSAYTAGVIEIKSDGTPWRPVLHVQDAAMAFMLALEAPADIVQKQAFHVGYPHGNYTVREIAEAVQKAVPKSKVTYTGEHGSDARTYKISFKKFYNAFGDRFAPQWTMQKGAEELVSFFGRIGFTEDDFRGRRTNRLLQIKHLLDTKRVNAQLEWI